MWFQRIVKGPDTASDRRNLTGHYAKGFVVIPPLLWDGRSSPPSNDLHHEEGRRTDRLPLGRLRLPGNLLAHALEAVVACASVEYLVGRHV